MRSREGKGTQRLRLYACEPLPARFERAQPATKLLALLRLHKPPEQVGPVRVCSFYQRDLPAAIPLLELLFSGNRTPDISVLLEPDEFVDMIFFRETFECPELVLQDSALKVARDAGVECSVAAARKDVDEVALHAAGA